MPKLNSIVNFEIDTEKRECVCEISTSATIEVDSENEVEIHPTYHDKLTFREGISFEDIWKKVGEKIGNHAQKYGDTFGC